MIVTLFYSIFELGDIEENSIADINGHIMVGDQIIKINDTHVQNIEDAYKMMREKDEIALVVARPIYSIHGNNFMADEPETDLDLDYLESIKEEPSQFHDENQSTSSSKSYNTSSSGNPSKTLAYNNEGNDRAKVNEQQQQQQQQLDMHLLNYANSPAIRPRSSSKSSDSSALSKESKKSKSRSSDNSNNNNNNNNSNMSSREDLFATATISSSHNERSRVSRDKHKDDRPTDRLERHSKKYYSTRDHTSDFNSHSPRRGSSSSKSSKSKHSNNDSLKIRRKQDSYKDERNGLYNSPSELSLGKNSIKNSSHINLRSAMRPDKNFGQKSNRHVQIDPHPGWNEIERKVWEEFKIIQRMEAAERDSADPLRPVDVENAWCVRRSKDGKHVYIKKTNNNRNKQLKERGRQINDERGITTDDDAFTVYQGRYWNEDERRKQLTRHQEKKRRLMQKINEREMIDHSLERDMAELVQRKMTIPSRVFDDFLTVEEILSQRNRAGICNGPIHVTTI